MEDKRLFKIFHNQIYVKLELISSLVEYFRNRFEIVYSLAWVLIYLKLDMGNVRFYWIVAHQSYVGWHDGANAQGTYHD